MWRDFTEYEYWIYSFHTTWPNTNIEYICSSQPYRIQILNIFVLSNLAEYKYRIYSKQENWIFIFKYIISSGYYSSIRIYSCYTVIVKTIPLKSKYCHHHWRFEKYHENNPCKKSIEIPPTIRLSDLFLICIFEVKKY